MAIRGGGRPSQVLGLPDVDGAPVPTPRDVVAAETRAAAGTPWIARRITGPVVAVLVVLVAAGAVLIGTTVLSDGGGSEDPPAAPALPLASTVATEDAVIALLGLFESEAVLADTVARVDLLSIPGPTRRAQLLSLGIGGTQARLEELRATPVGVGTPAESYVASSDHDALLRYVEVVRVHTQLIGTVSDLHDTLLTGAGTSSLATAEDTLSALRGATGRPALGAWAAALADVAAGAPLTEAQIVPLRAAAVEEWAAVADQVAPAALDDLTAFLNGVPQQVIDVVADHPVAGPALARLPR